MTSFNVQVGGVRLAVVLFAAMTVMACRADEAVGVSNDYGRAVQAMAAWAAAHPTEFRVEAEATQPVRRVSPLSCAQSNFITLRFVSDESRTAHPRLLRRWIGSGGSTVIHLTFQCPIEPGGSVAQLANALAFAVVEELPHGIFSRGWTFRLSTPTSSVRTGVTLEELNGGKLRVRIDTPLYALAGYSQREICSGRVFALAEPPFPNESAIASAVPEVPSDVMPYEPPMYCFHVQEHRISLKISITGELDPSVFSGPL